MELMFVIVLFAVAFVLFSVGANVFEERLSLTSPVNGDRYSMLFYNSGFRKIAAKAFAWTAGAWLAMSVALFLLYDDQNPILTILGVIFLVALAASIIAAWWCNRSSKRLMLDATVERGISSAATAFGTTRERLLDFARNLPDEGH